jgi:hypothetical protein
MRKDVLIRNGTKVDELARSIKEGAASLDNIPTLIRQVIENQMWRQHLDRKTGQVFIFDSFIEFVEAGPPEGLGTRVATVIRLCADDPLVVDLIDETVQLTAKEAVVINYPPKDTNGHDQAASRKYIATGASRQEGLRKLRHYAETHPNQGEPLRQAVLAGEKSVNRALIEAGLRPERITITRDPERAAEALKRSFSRDELKQLIRYLRQ